MAITLASSSTSNTGTLSAAGVGSGLDVNSIVTSLMAVENKSLTALDTQTASYQTKISAYGTVKAALARFQSSLATLKDPTTFGTLTAQSTTPDAVGVSVAGQAVAGTYSVQVTQLAQATKLVSDGFAATTDNVGSGSLTFQGGTLTAGVFTPNGSGARSVTIAPESQSLSGIRDAVNAAGIGVTATIVNDGSANGNRLVFTSTSSGAANSLKVTVSDADGTDTDNAGLSRLAFDPAAVAGSGRNLTQKVAAQDAEFVIDGIDVSKPTNTSTDAIEGVTLNALALTIGTGATISIAQDNSGATRAIQGFVTAYNTLNTTLVGLTKYDPVSKTGSTLTGDSTVRGIQSGLTAILTRPVAALADSGTTLDTLGQLGVSLQADGTLALDTTKLSAALAGNSNVDTLFAAVGRATDSLVGVTSTGTATAPGTYAVNVSSLATQGRAVGSGLASLSVTAGVNDQLDVTLDGTTATVTIGAGNYASAAALAAEVQSRINGVAAFSSNSSSVTLSASSGVLSATSARYGSASNIAFGGSAAATLFGAAPVSTVGTDVAGTIDGIAATGSGQSLRAAGGTAAEGLALRISGGTLGARGTVTFSQGYATTLDSLLTNFMASDGVIAAKTTGMTRSIADVADRRTELSRRLATVEAHYRAQFGALDTMLSSMNATSTYLTQQLASLPKIGTSSA